MITTPTGKAAQCFDFNLGSDNLFHTDSKRRFVASDSMINLLNKVALYNFLSTFSGTRFLQPRTVVVRFGISLLTA